ncbi:MAG: type II toxin-antitoxin system HicB family antitoxin [Candidatus Electryonea clarkiae]|nr:type II toxin-antitoxin system HicB family antitoxin [Candidatus Electryonea clarkiae]MDP8286450.1 type II toxin-antitoxin system HicB family antitoxin [Candidatus Electryonea clarkiae]
MKFLVIYEETDTGFSAFSPDLPGCIATGSSREEVEQNMKTALSMHIKGFQDEGMELPQPNSISTYLEVAS